MLFYIIQRKCTENVYSKTQGNISSWVGNKEQEVTNISFSLLSDLGLYYVDPVNVKYMYVYKEKIYW